MNRIAPIHDEDSTINIHRPTVNIRLPVNNEQKVCKICLEEENVDDPVVFTVGEEPVN